MYTPSPYHYLHQRNGLTYGSLLAGLFAVLLSKQSSWSAAWSLLTISVFFDIFDGRFASLFKRSDDEAAFGIQFDSLADAVVFGLVPVISLYLLLDPGNRGIFAVIWALGAFAYLVAGLTRLGCYNVHQASGEFFVGMPITMSALLLCTLAALTRSPTVFVLVLAACSCAMVIPMRFPRPTGWKMILLAGWVLAVFLSHVANIGNAP